MTRVSVFHNIDRDASFGLNARFASGAKTEAIEDKNRHPLVKVFTYDTATQDHDMAVCEEAFAAFNVGEDELAQRYRARRLRSLSVGDVITIDGQPYSCESAGWRARSADDLRVIQGANAEREIRSRYGFRPPEELSVTVPLTTSQLDWTETGEGNWVSTNGRLREGVRPASRRWSPALMYCSAGSGHYGAAT